MSSDIFNSCALLSHPHMCTLAREERERERVWANLGSWFELQNASVSFSPPFFVSTLPPSSLDMAINLLLRLIYPFKMEEVRGNVTKKSPLNDEIAVFVFFCCVMEVLC